MLIAQTLTVYLTLTLKLLIALHVFCYFWVYICNQNHNCFWATIPLFVRTQIFLKLGWCKVRWLKLLELRTLDWPLLTAFAANLAAPLARTDQAACCALTGFRWLFCDYFVTSRPPCYGLGICMDGWQLKFYDLSHMTNGRTARMPGASIPPASDGESPLECRGHLVMPGASTKQLHKKTASLRVGWIVSDTREEKSVTTVRFDWEISRPLLPARFGEE